MVLHPQHVAVGQASGPEWLTGLLAGLKGAPQNATAAAKYALWGARLQARCPAALLVRPNQESQDPTMHSCKLPAGS